MYETREYKISFKKVEYDTIQDVRLGRRGEAGDDRPVRNGNLV